MVQVRLKAQFRTFSDIFLPAGKKRASRLFANLLGTLRTFDAKTKDENVAEKRAEIDKKVDEKIATDRTVGVSIENIYTEVGKMLHVVVFERYLNF